MSGSSCSLSNVFFFFECDISTNFANMDVMFGFRQGIQDFVVRRTQSLSPGIETSMPIRQMHREVSIAVVEVQRWGVFHGIAGAIIVLARG